MNRTIENRPSDIDETASRANDEKTHEEREAGNRGGLVTDGKDGDIPAGGKRRGPGRWVNYRDRPD
jgi:hypothetical protein